MTASAGSGPDATGPVLRTARLVLRRWQPGDREPFARLNADPDVVRYLPGPLDRSGSDALVGRLEDHFRQHGYGLWAVQRRDRADLLGFTGLLVLDLPVAFSPAVEIGWRLARSAWGHGYATEAARAALAHGFDTVGLDEVVSMTTVGNIRSRAVMERLAMHTDPADDFAHPMLAPGNPLRPHVLYRLTRTEWQAARR